MKKLLVVCGPTATGKTSLALYLAKKFDGELVSADSRQVYRRLNIGTGKDLPKNVKCQMSNVKCFGRSICYYTISGVKLWGYDLVGPKEEFSVAQYVKISKKIINNIWSRKKLPILVGGTGLYIKGVVDGIPTAIIPKSLSLREKDKNKSVGELQQILGDVDPFRLASMNASDRKNPRRLVRAIEIARWKLEVGSGKLDNEVGSWKENHIHALFIGLYAPRKVLNKKIEERVEKRLKQGLIEEIRMLLRKGVGWEHQSMQALGYRQWKNYFEKFATAERTRAIEEWMTAEKQYAKRQLTWFKKDKQSLPLRGKRIKWFDASSKNFPKSVEKLVYKWHNK